MPLGHARRRETLLAALALVAVGCGPAATARPGATSAASPTPGASRPASPSPGPSTSTAWQRIPDELVFQGTALERATWTGNRFLVRARTEPVLFDSTDGRTWHRQQPFATDGRQSGPELIAAGLGGLIAIGGGSNVELAAWQSADGLTWSAVPSQDAFKSRDAAFQGVTGLFDTGHGWVAVGSESYMGVPRQPLRGLVLTSEDGTHWTRLTEQAALRGAEIDGIVRAPSGFLAVGTKLIDPKRAEAGLGPALWTSPNGRDWTSAGPASTFLLPKLPGWSGPTDAVLSGVAVLGERVVLLGSVRPSSASSPADYVPPLAVTWSLADGAWVPATIGAFDDAQQLGLVAGSTGFVAMTGTAPGCASGLWESGDGTGWQCTGTGPAFDGYVVTGSAVSTTVELLVGQSLADPVVGTTWTRPIR